MCRRRARPQPRPLTKLPWQQQPAPTRLNTRIILMANQNEKAVSSLQTMAELAKFTDGLVCPEGGLEHAISNAKHVQDRPGKVAPKLCKHRLKSGKRCGASLAPPAIQKSWRDLVSDVDEFGEVLEGPFEGRDGETKKKLCALAAHLVHKHRRLTVEEAEARIANGTLDSAFPALTAQIKATPGFTSILYPVAVPAHAPAFVPNQVYSRKDSNPPRGAVPRSATPRGAPPTRDELLDHMLLLPSQTAIVAGRLGIRTNSLPNESTTHKAIAILEMMQAQGRLGELASALNRLP